MTIGARFAKWGLGLFIFGVFLTFGIIAHYCVGARWPTGELFKQNITLWWACPWTLSVAAVQAGGLGMVAIGLTLMLAARISPTQPAAEGSAALWLCIIGLLGVFAVGYPGYFVFDAIWPSYYYSPVAAGKNAWLLGQALFIALYFMGLLIAFNDVRHALALAAPQAPSEVRRITMSKRLFVAFVLSCLTGGALAQTTPQERLVRSRAVEAAIWGMPIVNYDLMLQEMLTKTPGKVNQVIYWGKPLDWKNQTLTPNPDTLYFMAFLNTRDAGPMVIEIPPADANGSLNANFVNVWQAPLEDAGLLGVDKGVGVKLLMLPPGYKGQVPAGYETLQPDTWGSYGLIRSNLKSHGDADVAKSIAYAKQVKVYPLSQASNPPATVFTDIKDILFDTTIRFDESFYTNLDRMVQSEPWLDRDRAMIDQLRSIGIEKGKPFAPDAKMTQALKDGIAEAHGWMVAKYDAAPPQFFEGTHWTFPGHPDLIKAAGENFSDPNAYPVDWRGIAYHYAYIAIKRMGAGQFYLLNIKDKSGADYDGARTYRLSVPAGVPIEQYWSLTAYDRDTHALIKNVDRASRASNASDVKKNTNGSVDIYVGAKAPAGQASNWIPTDPARKFELMFRLYGPKKEFFEKKWALPDVERIDATVGTGATK